MRSEGLRRAQPAPEELACSALPTAKAITAGRTSRSASGDRTPSASRVTRQPGITRRSPNERALTPTGTSTPYEKGRRGSQDRLEEQGRKKPQSYELVAEGRVDKEGARERRNEEQNG